MMKMMPVFLPNKGVDLSKPEQFLMNTFSPYCRNMQYLNEELAGRPGFVKFDNYAFPDGILMVTQFRNLDGSFQEVVATKRDFASYDFGNKKWLFLTPQYITGTIEVQAGTPTILRGTGTLWLANMKVGDFVKLGAGTVDSTATWYEVLTVTDNTHATMKTAMPTTGAGANYVLRQTYTGGASTPWSYKQFLDLNLGQILICTNGVDNPVYYDGVNPMKKITGLPNSMTAARYIQIFGGRVNWLWTVEGGQNQPVRHRWSDVGNAVSYQAINSNDLILPDDSSWITGATVYNDFMAVFKDHGGAFIINGVDSTSIFSFSFISIFFGNFAPFSLMNILGKVYYFGYDFRFRSATIYTDDSTFNNISDYTTALEPNGAAQIFGIQLPFLDQVRWILPYDTTLNLQPVVVYNYKFDIIQIWEYNHPVGFNVAGSYFNTLDLFVDDPTWGPYYVDQQIGFWDDVTFLSGGSITLYGGRDGYVYQADVSTFDNGLTYPRTYQSTRLDFGMPNTYKRIWKQVPFLKKQTSGTVNVSWQRDDGTFDSGGKSISLFDATRDIIKPQITLDKEFENIKFQYTATNHFSMLGFLNWISKKRDLVK